MNPNPSRAQFTVECEICRRRFRPHYSDHVVRVSRSTPYTFEEVRLIFAIVKDEDRAEALIILCSSTGMDAHAYASFVLPVPLDLCGSCAKGGIILDHARYRQLSPLLDELDDE